MRRRTLILTGLALPLLGACGLLPRGKLVIVCDPDLVPVMQRAMTAWPDRLDYITAADIQTDISERTLGGIMEATQGGVIVTREPKQANRLQRSGLARLENRWTRDIAGKVEIVVTQGGWPDVRAAVAFAKWLASPAADRAVATEGPKVQTVAILTAP